VLPSALLPDQMLSNLIRRFSQMAGLGPKSASVPKVSVPCKSSLSSAPYPRGRQLMWKPPPSAPTPLSGLCLCARSTGGRVTGQSSSRLKSAVGGGGNVWCAGKKCTAPPLGALRATTRPTGSRGHRTHHSSGDQRGERQGKGSTVPASTLAPLRSPERRRRPCPFPPLPGVACSPLPTALAEHRAKPLIKYFNLRARSGTQS